ncbi:TniQ family protein [Leisingera aquaemixtae]|uniref:TniQ family protein n=1 Tax=Leisingera aquaemixtae TaxID=1396826 RepID=UPI0021A6B025|nr:TniQ family protein [Leisingera aquaemixtae]UWQ25702.1 TniQ family protein [Leisingera aquaemixtae]
MKPYLPPLEDESLLSWVNRFALFQCGMKMADFLRMISLPQQDLFIGRESVFPKLAAVFGVPAEELKACSHFQVSGRLYGYRGEVFFREFLVRNRPTYCPACLLSDIEASRNGLRVGAARIGWMFDPVRTCQHHNVPLVRARKATTNGMKVDVSYLSPNPADLERVLLSSVNRKPSGLQKYVEERLEGSKGPTWMDSQQIDLASRATEMLGACVEFGAHANLLKFTEDDWDRAGQVGFEFTSKGEEGIREGLGHIFRKLQKDTAQSGPQGIFGKLYQWAQFKKTDKPIGPFKGILREYILDTLPLEPGTMLLGTAVDRTRRHSVASLASKYAIHPQTITHALRKSGLLQSLYVETDRRCTVEARLAEDLIEKLTRTVPVKQIPSYIDCTRSHARLLVEAGILNPVIAAQDNTSGRYKGVDSRDLDQLIARMRQGGKPVEKPGLGMANVGDTAHALCAATTDIVTLLLNRRLDNVELLPSNLKFRSVLVDPKEVAIKLGVQTGETGVTISNTARELGVHLDVVRFLLQAQGDEGQPVLKTCGQYRHMGIMRDLVDPGSLDVFRKHYRKLSEIEGFWVRDPGRLRSELATKGIQPMWDPDLAGAEFYRASDL